MFLRSILSFFSVLAFGVMTAAAGLAVMPWISGHVPENVRALAQGLQFESVAVGMALGLTLGAIGRCNWSDIPRSIVTWFLVREQKFFYYALIAVCGGVLIFY
ncbi:hypothetical protein [Hyphomicrobium sp.]|uniref:hypothetical protein n=1 Tax=Hyphomicrobium sp. TaxID=82 RepID=UPI000FB25C6F|nr:hypothetical protein [Hyphomicrobium sp.]RUP00669.1 MAG: hypothetical protein EKK30_01015 [Hyphomicrobium sp.]